MTSTQGKKNSPPGNSRRRDAAMATDHAGTTPRLSSTPVSASSTGIEGLSTAPAPKTAPRPMCAPSVTMAREKMMASSSTMTGGGVGRLEHAADAHAPERWTRSPICAQLPTVAHVSTMVPDPTRAPMLT